MCQRRRVISSWTPLVLFHLLIYSVNYEFTDWWMLWGNVACEKELLIDMAVYTFTVCFSKLVWMLSSCSCFCLFSLDSRSSWVCSSFTFCRTRPDSPTVQSSSAQLISVCLGLMGWKSNVSTSSPAQAYFNCRTLKGNVVSESSGWLVVFGILRTMNRPRCPKIFLPKPKYFKALDSAFVLREKKDKMEYELLL